jgi:hypothetical protein
MTEEPTEQYTEASVHNPYIERTSFQEDQDTIRELRAEVERLAEGRQGRWMAATIVWTLFIMVMVTLLILWVMLIWLLGELVLL